MNQFDEAVVQLQRAVVELERELKTLLEKVRKLEQAWKAMNAERKDP